MKKRNLTSLRLNKNSVSILSNLNGGAANRSATNTEVLSCLKPTEAKNCKPIRYTNTYCGNDCVGATGAFC